MVSSDNEVAGGVSTPPATTTVTAMLRPVMVRHIHSTTLVPSSAAA